MPRALLPSRPGPVSSFNGENKILPPPSNLLSPPLWGQQCSGGSAKLCRRGHPQLLAAAGLCLGQGETRGALVSPAVYEDADGAGGGHQAFGRGSQGWEQLPGTGAGRRLPRPAASLPSLQPACLAPCRAQPLPTASCFWRTPPRHSARRLGTARVCAVCARGRRGGKSRQRDPVPPDELSEALQIVPEQGR